MAGQRRRSRAASSGQADSRREQVGPLPRRLRDALARPGFSGVMAFARRRPLAGRGRRQRQSAGGLPDGRPGGRWELTASPEAAAAVTLMVDDVAQLDLVDAESPTSRAPSHPGLRGPRCLLAATGRPGAHRSAAITTAQLRRRRGPAGTARRQPSRVRSGRGNGVRGADRRHGRRPDRPAALRCRGPRRSSASFGSDLAGPTGERRSPRSAEVTKMEFVNGGGTGSVAAHGLRRRRDRGHRRIGPVRP